MTSTDRELLCALALRAGAGALLAAPAPRAGSAATERRFVFVIQRGARRRPEHVVPVCGSGLCDAARRARDRCGRPRPSSTARSRCIRRSPKIAKLYSDKQALFVHAVASPYRDRSHFDGQNVLETGGSRAVSAQGRLDEPAGRRVAARTGEAIAFAPTVPLALRGAVGGGAAMRLRRCRRRTTTCCSASSSCTPHDRAAARAVVRGNGCARHGWRAAA